MKEIEFIEGGYLKGNIEVKPGDRRKFPAAEADGFVANGVARHCPAEPPKSQEKKTGGDK